MEMDNKKIAAEFLGSMVIVMIALGSGGDATMFTGLVLAIMLMVFAGAEILPMMTIGNMATGRTDPQQGALNFVMQILGATVATAVMGWRAGGSLGDMTWTAGGSMDATALVGAIIGGFMLGVVWDRCGGGSWQTGSMGWARGAGGMVISSAGEMGSMVVTSGWDSATLVLGTMICGAVGVALSNMLGEKFLFEEE